MKAHRHGKTPPASRPAIRPKAFALVLAGAVTFAAVIVTAQSAAEPPSGELAVLRQELAILKEEVAALRTALEQHLKPAAPRSPIQPANQIVPIAGAPVRGSAGARVTIVEFSDYECPFCGRYNQQVLPQIQRDYVDTDKVRYVFRDFPLESIHPTAFKAHEAAACAGEQGGYWDMHGRLFADQAARGDEALAGLAREIGLDVAAFRSCLASQAQAEAVRAGIAAGRDAGITGTPTFLIGVTGPDGSLVATKQITGAQPYAVFREAIDDLLANAGAGGAR